MWTGDRKTFFDISAGIYYSNRDCGGTYDFIRENKRNEPGKCHAGRQESLKQLGAVSYTHLEGNQFVATQDFAEEVQKSDNYFVIVTRESLPMLPYSVEEIYGIHNSGKYGNLKCIYNEMYHIYGTETIVSKIHPDQIITEDSNSGFQFFYHIGEENGVLCKSAEGKSNIFVELTKIKEAEEILVIADGAAIGSEMEKLMNIRRVNQHIHFYLPESFEWLILQSGVLDNREINNILREPEKHIDSKEYFSWERFFTALLIQKTRGTYLAYTKSKLNPAYLYKTTMEKIVRTMENIDFS